MITNENEFQLKRVLGPRLLRALLLSRKVPARSGPKGEFARSATAIRCPGQTGDDGEGVERPAPS